jgi:polyisoprenoid-binding protein YceI
MEHGDGLKRALEFLLLAGAFLSGMPAALAQTVHVTLDPSQTKISWALPAVLHVAHGTFDLSSGDMAFNTKSGTAWGMFVVNENTGQSGDKTRDTRMKKSVLKTAEYPTATFQPQHVTGAYRASGASTLVVDGIFHIYGADHPLQLDFQVETSGNALTATTKFDVPYVAWGMHDPSTMLLRVDKSAHVEIDAKGTVEIAK